MYASDKIPYFVSNPEQREALRDIVADAWLDGWADAGLRLEESNPTGGPLMNVLLAVSTAVALACFISLAAIPAADLSQPLMIGLVSGASLGCLGMVIYGVVTRKKP